jgi:OOP family OmpA-OmpF porin
MKNLLILSMIILPSILNGQNLAQNPSFEDTLQCPNFPQPFINYATNWSSFGGSPDYFNICANSSLGLLGVPYNGAGYQMPLNGNAYAGLMTWYVNAGSSIREYQGVQLTQNLTIGVKYFASCYISNADSVGFNSSSNNFGIKFSTVSYSNTAQSIQVLMNNFSHIHSDSVINNKLTWIRIAGSFIADSAYQYLVLGNFYDDAHTIVDTVPPISQTGSYYYIDAVCVSTDSIYDSLWTSIKTLKREIEKEIFPNPTKDEIWVSNNYDSKVIRITDIVGKNILTRQLIFGLNKIEISSIAAGMYLIFLDDKFYKRIIVQH